MTTEFAVLRYIEFVHNRTSLSLRSYVEYRIDVQTLAEGICYRNLKLINIQYGDNIAIKIFFKIVWIYNCNIVLYKENIVLYKENIAPT